AGRFTGRGRVAGPGPFVLWQAGRMGSRFTELSMDGHDLRRLADFWCEVLGYRILDEKDGWIEIGDHELTPEEARAGAVAPTIVFAPVPETKSVKNRVHID